MTEKEPCAVRHTSPVEQISTSRTSVPYGTEDKTSGCLSTGLLSLRDIFLSGCRNITTLQIIAFSNKKMCIEIRL